MGKTCDYMQKLFLCLSVIGMILTGCSKNDDGESGKPNNNGNEQPENPDESQLPELPALPDPDDVCSAMDDLNFMAYCYENFDVNKDGKVSLVEANAVKEIDIHSKQIKSLKGIERFPNLEILLCYRNPIEELDLRYNLKITATSVNNNIDFTGAFEDCTNLERILLPSTLKVIEKNAFRGCSSLGSMNILPNLTLIEQGAFCNCSSLTNINIPESSIIIKSSTFQGCSSLIDIKLPPNLTSIEQKAFYGCSSLTSINLPPNLISIEAYAFSDCTNLASIDFPKNLKTLGHNAFSGSGLTSINIPNGWTYLGQEIFYGCSNLTSIVLPKSMRQLYYNTFTFCKFQSVICYAENPPLIETTFASFSRDNDQLYVPATSVDVYKSSDWAQYFKNILSIE